MSGPTLSRMRSSFCLASERRGAGHGGRAIARCHDEHAGRPRLIWSSTSPIAGAPRRLRDARSCLARCLHHPRCSRGSAGARSLARTDAERGVEPRLSCRAHARDAGRQPRLCDPAADWPTVMAALDAEVLLRGPRGSRAAAAVDFGTGVYETVRATDEIVDSVRIPKLSASARWGYASSAGSRENSQARSPRWCAIPPAIMGVSCSARSTARPSFSSEPGPRPRRQGGRFGPAIARICIGGISMIFSRACMAPWRARRRSGADMTRICMRVNSKAVVEDVPGRLSLADFLRERETDRHASGMRARRVRGVHDPCRRRTRALLPHVCGRRRRRRYRTVEGLADAA